MKRASLSNDGPESAFDSPQSAPPTSVMMQHRTGPELSLMSDTDRTLEWSRMYANPHCAQLYVDHSHRVGAPIPFSRTLSESSGFEPYRRRRDERKSVLHWGQRKLLMSEIEFLTRYAHKGCTVVYAGAAPGKHIGFLADCFPDVAKFILVDPAHFMVEESGRVEIRQGLFTDDMALEFSGQDILFISDIRTANYNKLTEEEVEEAVRKDMEAQRRWHTLSRAKFSMLKFRLPWDQSKSQYLDGTVFWPVWGPQTTSETRLVVSQGVHIKEWDHQRYEGQCFFFNTVTRAQRYHHRVHSKGLDHCFDCASEVDILRRYIEKVHATWLTGDNPDDPSPLECIRHNEEERNKSEDERKESKPAADKADDAVEPSEEKKEYAHPDPSATASVPRVLNPKHTSLVRSRLWPVPLPSPAVQVEASASASVDSVPSDIGEEQKASAGEDSDHTPCATPSLATTATESNGTSSPGPSHPSISSSPRSVQSASSGGTASEDRQSSGSSQRGQKRSRDEKSRSDHGDRYSFTVPKDPTADPEMKRLPFPTSLEEKESYTPGQLDRLLRCIADLVEKVSTACTAQGRTLTTVLPPPEKRRKFQGVF